MVFPWNPNWPTVKNDWTPEDGVTDQDFNDIADAIIAAMNGMDNLVDAVVEYVTNEVTLQNLKNIYAVGTGTDTYTVAIPGITNYDTGAMYNIVIPNINTGACTLNINGLGAKDIRKEDNTALDAGDLVGLCQFVYNGTNFRLTSGIALGAIKKDIKDLMFEVMPLWLTDAEIAARVEYLDYFLTTSFVTTVAPMLRVMEPIAKSVAGMEDIVATDAYMTTFSNDTNACTQLGKYSPAVKAIVMDTSVFNIMKLKSTWYNSVNTNAASMTTVSGQLFNIYEDTAFLNYLAADTNGTLTFLKTNCPNFMTQLGSNATAINILGQSLTAMTILSASSPWREAAAVGNLFADNSAAVTTVKDNSTISANLAASAAMMSSMVASNVSFPLITEATNSMTTYATNSSFYNAVFATPAKLDYYLGNNNSKKVGALLNAKSATTGISTYENFATLVGDSTALTNVNNNATLATAIYPLPAAMNVLVTYHAMNVAGYTVLNTIFSSPSILNAVGSFGSALLTGKANLTAVFADTVTANLVAGNKVIARGLLSVKACSDIVLAASYGVGRCVDSANELNNATFQSYNTLANLFNDSNFRLATLNHIGISQALCKNYTILQNMLNTYPESTYNALHACNVTLSQVSNVELEDDGNGLRMLYGKNITVNNFIKPAKKLKALIVIADGTLTVASTGKIDTKGKMWGNTALGSTPWTNRADLNRKTITINAVNKLLVCPYAFTGATLKRSLTSGGAGGNGGASNGSYSGAVGAGTSGYAFSGGAGGGGAGYGVNGATGGAGGTFGVNGSSSSPGWAGGGGGGYGGNGGQGYSGSGSTMHPGGLGLGEDAVDGAGGAGYYYGGGFNGAGGGGGSSYLGQNYAGGGGGSGSSAHIILSADVVTINASGIVTAAGGNGGEGGNWSGIKAGNGGGAGGGYIYVAYKTSYTNNGTVTVAGGAAGNANGNGGVAGGVGTITTETIA